MIEPAVKINGILRNVENTHFLPLFLGHLYVFILQERKHFERISDKRLSDTHFCIFDTFSHFQEWIQWLFIMKASPIY